ncbi:regulatory factor X-associated protein-like isoform X2 [Anneissia japonica]|nr:regulatory factor X-associated protein-like isoform X2 [Anneissia japonica]
MAEQSCPSESIQSTGEKSVNGTATSSDRQTCGIGDCKEAAFRFKSGAWICRYHRNKGYKEKYRKKSKYIAAQAKMREQESMEDIDQLSGLGDLIDAAFPEHQQFLADQIITDKKMALLQSPMVQQFLRSEQEKLCNKSHDNKTPESI